MTDSNNNQNLGINSSEGDNFNNNYWINRLLTWWSGFSLRTKLLAIATPSKSINDRNNFLCT